MAGSIGILNVGAGDTKLVFDKSNPAETAKSAAIVLLIEVGNNEKGPIYQRAHDFDAETAEYIVAGPSTPAPEETTDVQVPPVPPRRRSKGKAPTARIAASSTNAVAVARTAGG
jgi:hypothetical protein